MFKQLIRGLTTKDLMKSAMDDMDKMMVLIHKMIQSAVLELTEDQPIKFDIAEEDEKLNQLQKEIRSKVIRHLHINPKEDILISFTLVTAIIFIERVGDYAKNIHSLKGSLSLPFADVAYSKELVELGEKVLEVIVLARSALSSENETDAKKVIELHRKISNKANKMIEELVKLEKSEGGHVALAALYARYLKRISGHLMNAASTVINAFDMIGFYPGKGGDDE